MTTAWPGAATAQRAQAAESGKDETDMRDTTTATTQRRDPGGTSPREAPHRAQMAGDVESLRDARRLVADALSGSPEDVRDAAVLLAGEVITNAVVHGGGWFLLQVDADPARVRIEVTDSSAGRPRVLTSTGDREHGRGMAIVDAIATAWGTVHLGTHKSVWFELAVST